MVAQIVNLSIDAGSTWQQSFTVALGGLALTGDWVASSQIRPYADSAELLYQFPVSVSGSVVTLAVPAADSAAWAFTHGVYDVLITQGSSSYRIVQGAVSVNAEVTQS